MPLTKQQKLTTDQIAFEVPDIDAESQSEQANDISIQESLKGNF